MRVSVVMRVGKRWREMKVMGMGGCPGWDKDGRCKLAAAVGGEIQRVKHSETEGLQPAD